MMRRRLDIVYLSTRSYDDQIWTAAQQVARALSRLHRVVLVDPPQSAASALRPGGIGAFNRRLRRVSERLWVFTPLSPAPRGSSSGLMAGINRLVLRRELLRCLDRLGFKEYQLWVLSPRHGFLGGTLGETTLVYKCDGEVATFPWLRSARGWMVREEEKLLQKADAVFCTSPSIAERKAAVNPRTFLVRLGVDEGLFFPARGCGPPVPDDLRAVPSPRIGYVGALDRYKVDFGLLRALSVRRPQWHWVLIGPCGISDGTTPADLPRAPNLHYLGPRERRQVPPYLLHCQALVIPYALNEYTRNLTTLKMHEYLATGLPIVAVALPHFQRLQPLVRLASGAAEFERELAAALEEKDDRLRDGRIAVAADNSWERQVERMLGYLDQVESGKSGCAHAELRYDKNRG